MNGNVPATMPTDDSMSDSTDMSSLNINVPPEMQAKVAAWQDGEEYHVTISQTGPGQFDLVAVEGDDAGAPSDSDQPDAISGGNLNDTAGTTIPQRRPAVAAIIMARRNGRK